MLWLEKREEENGAGDEGVQALSRQLLAENALPALIQMQKDSGIFSSVDTIDDLSTTDLRQLLAHYYAGTLFLKLTGVSSSSASSFEPQDRLGNVQRGRAHLSVFIGRCKNLSLISALELAQFESTPSLSAADKRAAKIARYQREKSNRESLKRLMDLRDKQRKARRGRRKNCVRQREQEQFYHFSVTAVGDDVGDDHLGNSKPNSYDDDDDDDDFYEYRPAEMIGDRERDDAEAEEMEVEAELNLFATEETAREFWLRTIDQAIVESLSQLEQSKSEADMLTAIVERIRSTPGGKRAFDQQVDKDRQRREEETKRAAAEATMTAASSSSASSALSSLSLVPSYGGGSSQSVTSASLLAQMDGAKKSIFRPGWIQPTMTPEQAAEAEMAAAAAIQAANEVAEREAKYGQQDSARSEDEEEDDEDKAQTDDGIAKARSWDEWKDDHKRGEGNLYNQG